MLEWIMNPYIWMGTSLVFIILTMVLGVFLFIAAKKTHMIIELKAIALLKLLFTKKYIKLISIIRANFSLIIRVANCSASHNLKIPLSSKEDNYQENH
jgi:hypothetical protein